eukprot:NODE_7729_length_551_cov_2.187251_g6697_i0.p5 GENE.NODE_7729_length_551_cov_2.187251_g6697_i0~~NODE_7729_length_551_cov_2.187251_g6697_i0.p5  ORF type:complete len:56 (-),score=0.88 NODE_7729_length_551_cov_2.187251_g6697_i0:240-407(-)
MGLAPVFVNPHLRSKCGGVGLQQGPPEPPDLEDPAVAPSHLQKWSFLAFFAKGEK